MSKIYMKKFFSITNYQKNKNQDNEMPSHTKKNKTSQYWMEYRKKGPLCTDDGNGNWFILFRKTIWTFLTQLRIHLPYCPSIPSFGVGQSFYWALIGPNQSPIILFIKNACNPIFFETLFTIVKIGKQFKCPRKDDQIEKL